MERRSILQRKPDLNNDQMAKSRAKPPDDSDPDSLSISDIVNMNSLAFSRLPEPRPGCTLLRTLSPGALQAWCEAFGIRPNVWSIDKAMEAKEKLKIFSSIRHIAEKIRTADVTVLKSPTGTGKTQVGPLLLVEVLGKSQAGEKYKGLTVCPSGHQARRMIKQSEKLYMTNGDAYVEILNYCNPFDRVDVLLDKEKIAKNVQNPPEYAITNHRGALMALGINAHPKLKLLVIDEAHSTKPEIVLLLERARRLLKSGNVEKLMLSSATLDRVEIGRLTRYFAEAKLTVEVIDLSEELEPTTRQGLTLSCVRLESGFRIGNFEATPLSKQLTEDFANKDNAFHTMGARWGNCDLTESEEMEERGARPHFGKEETDFIPEMNHMMPYVKQAVERGMECATEKLDEMLKRKERLVMEGKPVPTMPSILVILPGREHIDRMICSLERTLEYMELEEEITEEMERKKKLRELKMDSKRFMYYMYKNTKEPAFIVERLKSTTNKGAIVGKKKKDEEEFEGKELPAELIGAWGGKKGRIILATPQAAEGLTLNDVFLVIDSGVIRINALYSKCGLRYLDLTWVDKKMLLQRAGRCGRTMQGEFFLCASGMKVAHMLKSNFKEDLLKREFDESAWYRAKQLPSFNELIWQPPTSLTDQYEDSFRIRGLMEDGKFTEEVKLLYSYFPDTLSPEQARFVVMGVRLGLAAHVICYVADSISSHKICGRPTKIAKNWEALGESDAYETFVNVSALSTYKDKQIRPYDMGDSVAKADLITTWVRHLFPTDDDDIEPNFDAYETYTDEKWKAMEERAAKTPDGVFWSGRWCMGKEGEEKNVLIGMKRLQQVMIRDEGREAAIMLIHQLIRGCQRLEIITADDPVQGRGNFLSPRFNRYRRGKGNFNLNEDGRALFRALLTMSSDKMARADVRSFRERRAGGSYEVRDTWDRFKIYDPTPSLTGFIPGYPAGFIFPERRDWKERDNQGTAKYVRFWEGFMPTHGGMFTGSCDRLTTAQAAIFMNVKGVEEWEENMIKIPLNASPKPKRSDLAIKMDAELAKHVRIVRESLKKNITRLLHERGEFDDFAQAVIDLWMVSGDEMEANMKILPKWEKEKGVLALYHGRGAPELRKINEQLAEVLHTKMLKKTDEVVAKEEDWEGDGGGWNDAGESW